MSVKIITDSTSDIQREEAEKLGLGMVPLKVIMDGETYRDGIDISKAEYFSKLPGMKKLPTTTQPSPDEFIREFEKAEEDELVVILIGGGVSAGVVADFRREYPASRAFHLSGKTVLDSGMVYRNAEVSMGLPSISEFQVWRTEEDAIRRAAEALAR